MKHGRQLMLKCDRGVWKPGTLIRKHSKERRSSSGKKDYQEKLYKVLVEDELEPRVLDLQRVRFRFQKDVRSVIRTSEEEHHSHHSLIYRKKSTRKSTTDRII